MGGWRARDEVDRKRAAHRKLQIMQWLQAHPNPLTWLLGRAFEQASGLP